VRRRRRCSTEAERVAFPHVDTAAPQVGAEMRDYLGLMQLIGRLAAARGAPRSAAEAVQQ
jgi:hypothetical protein